MSDFCFLSSDLEIVACVCLMDLKYQLKILVSDKTYIQSSF